MSLRSFLSFKSSGIALPTLFLLFCLAPQEVHSQDLRALTGYNELAAELGGAPAGLPEILLVPSAANGWKYRRGTSEASNPGSAWRQIGFNEDGTWTSCQTPVGYGDGDDNTVLGDMQGRYSSIYLRRIFTIANGDVPERLLLRAYVDDGAIVWINGVEVARFHVDIGFRPFNSFAQVHEAEWEDMVLLGSGSYLQEGENVIAVHALNQSLASSDFSIDVELRSLSVGGTQVEAGVPEEVSPGVEELNYLPQGTPVPMPTSPFSFSGDGTFSGTELEVGSFGQGFGRSSHARTVGNHFYGNSRSLAPTLGRVRCFHASSWLGLDYLRRGFAEPPRRDGGLVQNHSWIGVPNVAAGETPADYNRILRRIDFAVERDGIVMPVGLNNGDDTEVPPLVASAFNVISVGRSDGNHSRGGTLAPYDGSGRVKPEIVAPGSATSFSTATVSGGVALLLQAANGMEGVDMNNVFRPEVTKAILLAGATKDEFPNWSRTATVPLDPVFGAGELNVLNNHRILVAGEQPAGPFPYSLLRGWDYNTVSSSLNRTYRIQVPEGQTIDELSLVVTWNRQFTNQAWSDDFAASPTLPDVNLELRDGSDATLDTSVSGVDNVEHIHARNLPAGDYTFVVSTDRTTDFGIAWRTTIDQGLNSGPRLTPVVDLLTSLFRLEIENLEPGADYVVQKSGDLTSWIPQASPIIPGSLEGEGRWTDPVGLSPDPVYYRLRRISLP